jgi:hypothetical protein
MSLEEKKKGYRDLKKTLASLSQEELIIWAAINTIVVVECLEGTLPQPVREIFVEEDMNQYQEMMLKAMCTLVMEEKNHERLQ